MKSIIRLRIATTALMSYAAVAVVALATLAGSGPAYGMPIDQNPDYDMTGNDMNLTGTIDNPGWNMDDNIYAGWNFAVDQDNNLTGTGYLDLYNVGSETRSVFEWTIPDLTSLTCPGGWDGSYDANTDLLTLSGNLGVGGNITVPHTFDPTNKELGEINLHYEGSETEGNLDIVGVGENTAIVPEPGTMMLIGAGVLALAGVVRKRVA